MRVLIIVLCLISNSLFAQFRCIKVMDGSTFLFQDDSSESVFLVALKDVKSPEYGQGYYRESTNFLISKILGKIVYLADVENMLGGRFLATVLCEGIIINNEVVRTGHCYVLHKYCTDHSLYKAEQEAKNYCLGVYGLCNEMNNSDFKRLKKKKL
jgi:hypothetical protein